MLDNAIFVGCEIWYEFMLLVGPSDEAEIIEGEGSKAHEGDLVEVNYLCRRSNGYFVHRVSQQVEFWSFVIFIWQCSEITVLGT
ncbi:peptidyl-prolyl cis-trans isomerase FKBP16-1, chloroplastic [Fagus crenata]